MAKRYCIVPVADLTQQMVDDCIETSMDTLRKSVNELSTVLKYEGSKPSSVSSYTDYSHESILTIMATPAWTPEEE